MFTYEIIKGLPDVIKFDGREWCKITGNGELVCNELNLLRIKIELLETKLTNIKDILK
jgi:hypothetical protein